MEIVQIVLFIVAAYGVLWVVLMISFEIYRFFADIKFRRWLADKPLPPVYRYVHPPLPVVHPKPEPIRSPETKQAFQTMQRDLERELFVKSTVLEKSLTGCPPPIEKSTVPPAVGFPSSPWLGRSS